MEWLPTQETCVIWATNAVMASFLLVTVIGAGRFVRRQFKTRVNCWFCNKNTWVAYGLRNQWTCPGCEQYNGFKEDGDYNKDLLAQYSPKYNKQPVPRLQPQQGAPSQTTSSGKLCPTCCRNQELKVHRLASFTASDEAAYDEEVERYKEQLEDLYRLCPGCERTVRRCLNQAKTLILGIKGRRARAKDRKRAKPVGLFGRVKRFVAQMLLLAVVVILANYFVNIQAIKAGSDWKTYYAHFTANSESATGFGNMGYRLALGFTILVLLGKGKPMNANEYISVICLCSLHFLIGEQMLQATEIYPMVAGYMVPVEWILRVVALLSSGAMLLSSFSKSPVAAIKFNNSFHRIEVDDEENADEADQRTMYGDSLDDSRSTSYLPTPRLDTSTDFGSVFEYQPSVASGRQPVTVEDEEIRNISFNSRHVPSTTTNTSFLNRSDPQQYQESDSWQTKQETHNEWSKSPSRSTANLHSPSKLFPDDRFSNSIQSMKIGSDYHQLHLQRTTSMNPFLRNIPLGGSNSPLSRSSATICGSSRSLLTPSRLSLVSGGGASAFHEAKSTTSWLTSPPGSSGFWNNQYPNVFTARPTAFSYAAAASPAKTIASHSLDHGLNERFVPLTESRSSSQSSGFESRQSTGSVQLPAFSPIGGGGRESVLSGSRKSVFSVVGKAAEGGNGDVDGERDTMGMGCFFAPNVFPR